MDFNFGLKSGGEGMRGDRSVTPGLADRFAPCPRTLFLSTFMPTESLIAPPANGNLASQPQNFS